MKADIRKFTHERIVIDKEQRRAQGRKIRQFVRTPSRSLQRQKDNEEIAAYLARVPPRQY